MRATVTHACFPSRARPCHHPAALLATNPQTIPVHYNAAQDLELGRHVGHRLLDVGHRLLDVLDRLLDVLLYTKTQADVSHPK
jgi:hypothetical protein